MRVLWRNNMKITVLTRSYPTTGFGGLPNVCKSLCDGLAKAGHEIIVLTMTNPHKPIAMEIVGKVRIEYLPCRPLSYTEEWYELATKRVGEIKPNIIYSESGAGHYVVDKYPDIPSVQRLHGFSYEEMITWQRNLIDQGIVRYEDAIQVGTELARYMGKVRSDRVNAQKYSCLVGLTEVNCRNIKYILQPKRTEMIRNGIDTEKFDYIPLEQKLYDVVFVGHLTRMKGIMLLDEAMGIVKKRCAIKCFAFGDNTEKLNLQNIEQMGPIENDKLPEIYNKAKIFVNPSLHYTGMDTTIMEATCCGLPCIVSEGENLEEIINKAAIYGFARGDAEALAATIIAVYKERNDYNNREISNVGRVMFSQERMVKEHVKLFNSLIDK